MSKNTQELLQWHEKLSHIGFQTLQTLASKLLIPRKLAKCTIPVCSSCQYGQAKRQSLYERDFNPIGGAK